MGEQTASGSRRLTTLDALRGCSVFAMIHQHVGIWLWEGPAPGKTNLDYPVLVSLNAGVAIGAPLFFALSGAGTALLCLHARDRGIDGVLVRRGAMLWLFGLGVNLLTPSWFSWGSFFALHMMGVGIALAPVWRRLGDATLLAIAAAILAMTPLAQAWVDTPTDLTNPDMRDVSVPGGALRLAIVGSQYSLLPWLSTFVVGFWAGRTIHRGALRSLVVAGTAIFVVGALGHAWIRLTDTVEPELLWRAFRLKVGWFPPSIAIVTLLLGPTLWILALAVRRHARRPLPSDHVLVALGRISLTVFIVHAPLFRELSRPLGIWSALSPIPVLATIAAFTLACVLLARWWGRHDYRYGAEWLMRKLADRR